MSVYPFIEAEKVAARSVSQACALLSVSGSACSVWHGQRPSARARSDERLGEAIVEIHRTWRRTYGAPRITAALRRQGIRVGKQRVARLMRGRGLVGRAKRRWKRTTIPDPAVQVAALDRLGRAFAPASCALDRISIGDITDIRTHEGWLYLATTIDLASRRVVGFAMADHPRASLVCEALAMALERRHPAPGLIVHSDRGSQGGFNWSSQHLDTWRCARWGSRSNKDGM
jgi:transposase InsO family protein